jgi:transcriptional regulator with XRE-family HTH domain
MKSPGLLHAGEVITVKCLKNTVITVSSSTKYMVITILSSIKSGNYDILSVMESNFRQNLRDELAYQDLTVKELAAKSGVAKGALDCYVGKQASVPPATTAVKIARALGVSVEYLVSGQKHRHEETAVSYSPRVRSILQIFNNLDEENQDIIVEIARILRRHNAHTK